MQTIFRSSIGRAQVLGARQARLASFANLNRLRNYTNTRSYGTETPSNTPPKNPGKPLGNSPLYLSIAGLVGLGYYVYIVNTESPKAKAPTVATTSALDKDNFVEFPLLKKQSYNHNTTAFTFKLPENTGTLLPVAGLVLLKAVGEDGPKDKKGNPIVRPYTPVSPADKPGEVTFLIKKYDTGKFTPYLFDLPVGAKIAIKGPLPKIPYKANEYDQIAMIAGGSGITPMFQVLRHALSNKDDKTKFTLIFANVSPADILLREDFDQMKKEHPDRFEPVFVVDKPDDNWTGYTGHISSQLIRDYVKPPTEKVKIYVCGPPGQVSAIAGPKDGMKQGALAGTLKELGYTEDHVFKF